MSRHQLTDRILLVGIQVGKKVHTRSLALCLVVVTTQVCWQVNGIALTKVWRYGEDHVCAANPNTRRRGGADLNQPNRDKMVHSKYQ